jgi:hypothetical protein
MVDTVFIREADWHRVLRSPLAGARYAFAEAAISPRTSGMQCENLRILRAC